MINVRNLTMSDIQDLNGIRCERCLTVFLTYQKYLNGKAFGRGCVVLVHEGFVGEHGMGTLKCKYMQRALETVLIKIQICIKQTLDSFSILNPDNILPEQLGTYQQAD